MALLPRLTPQRRRDLLAALQQLVEDNVTLDFDRIHLAALLDADVATRILAMHGLREHDRLEYAELLSGHRCRRPDRRTVRAEAAAGLGKLRHRYRVRDGPGGAWPSASPRRCATASRT